MPVESPTRRGRPCPKPITIDMENRESSNRNRENFLIDKLQLVSGRTEPTLSAFGRQWMLARFLRQFHREEKTGGLRKNSAWRRPRARLKLLGSGQYHLAVA